MAPWKSVFYQPVVFTVHVSLPGCTLNISQTTMQWNIGRSGGRDSWGEPSWSTLQTHTWKQATCQCQILYVAFVAALPGLGFTHPLIIRISAKSMKHETKALAKPDAGNKIPTCSNLRSE